MPETLKLMGIGPTGEIVPIRVDDKGRFEFVQVPSGDEATPTVSSAISSVPALAGTFTVNPTRPTLLYEGLLSGSDATLYTAAANWRSVEIYLVNVDTSARTATLYSGSPGSDANTIVRACALEVAGRVPVFLPALASAGKINGFCDSANKVKIEIWGVAA